MLCDAGAGPVKHGTGATVGRPTPGMTTSPVLRRDEELSDWHSHGSTSEPACPLADTALPSAAGRRRRWRPVPPCYSGLNRTFATLSSELQYRESADSTPRPSTAFSAAEQGLVQLRSARRLPGVGGVSIRKPVTDRIVLFGAVGYNWRNASSNVFNVREVSLRGNLNYALARRHTFYLGLEYRDGDVQTTDSPSRRSCHPKRRCRRRV